MQKKQRFLAIRQSLTKILLLMKLSIVLILITSLHLSAKTYSQQMVTLKFQSTELKTVLKQIEKKSSYRFLYNNDVIASNQKITLDVNNVPVAAVLDDMFKNSALTYRILDNNLVVITQKTVAVQDIKVTGKVTDANGQAVPGVTVKIKGSVVGTSTDAAGNYALTVPNGARLVFSSVGYLSQEIPVNGRTEINVVMQIGAKDINEVVVIGYGVANKRDLTGSISKVSGSEVADRPNLNPISSLAGRVAGLSVVNSGILGSNPDIRILGTISKTQTAPLYVVDGIFNDDISFINPSDIESMEILKDASSLAVFGVRGANGVIIITTKAGKVGKLNVNFSTSLGVKKVVDKVALTNGPQYTSLYTQQRINDGQAPYPYWSAYTANTDWQDQLFSLHKGMINYNNVSISSGTDKNKFYMGLGYSTEEGVIKYEKLQKFTVTLKDELKVSKNLKFGFNVIGYQAKLPQTQQSAISLAQRALPIFAPFNTTANIYNQSPFLLQDAQVDNPLRVINEQHGQDLSNRYSIIGNVFTEINFLNKFTFKATYYADLDFNAERKYNPLVNMYNLALSDTAAVILNTSVTQKSSTTAKFQQDYLLTYANQFGDHGLTVLGGFSTVYNKYTEVNGQISQFKTLGSTPIPNDPRFWYLDNTFADPSSRVAIAPANDVFGNRIPTEWDQATVSFLARALYNYKGKYLLNASFRRDGSSDISPKSRYQNFEAVGLGWNITKEDFMQHQHLFDFLKLKASWGILGNQYTAIHYPFYPALTAGSSAVFGGNGGTLQSAYTASYVADPNLKWESVTSTSVGIELAVLRNRLSVDASYYNKQTKDLLTNYAAANGQKQGITNAGAILNKGIELSVTWKDKFKNGIGYFISGNFTTLHNKVTDLYKGAPIFDGASITKVGSPIGSFYGYVVNGVIQSSADSANSPQFSNPSRPGDLKFKDLTKNGVLSDSDRTVIGNPTPKFTYGFSLGMNYRGFDISADLQGVYGNQVFRGWGNGAGYARINYRTARLNAWHGAGTSNWEPLLSDGDANNSLNSTYMIENGSYLRIRNVQIGYTFNTQMLAKYHIKTLRFYISGQNLKTFKHNSGYTPEFGGSATSFGYDDGLNKPYPVPAIYTAGLNINF